MILVFSKHRVRIDHRATRMGEQFDNRRLIAGGSIPFRHSSHVPEDLAQAVVAVATSSYSFLIAPGGSGGYPLRSSWHQSRRLSNTAVDLPQKSLTRLSRRGTAHGWLANRNRKLF